MELTEARGSGPLKEQKQQKKKKKDTDIPTILLDD